jgi:hypothetical protein
LIWLMHAMPLYESTESGYCMQMIMLN